MDSADCGRALRADGVERLAALGVSSGRGRNEFDLNIRHELDHERFLRQCSNPPLWTRNHIPGRTDLRACAARYLTDADLLVHPVLDVPPEALPEDLSFTSEKRSKGPA